MDLYNKRGRTKGKIKGKVKIICEECGKEFETWPYKKHTAKYCSMLCKAKSLFRKTGMVEGLTKSKLNKNTSSVIPITCKNFFCRKTFLISVSDLDKIKYCSLDCFHYCRSNKYAEDLRELKKKIEEKNKREAIWKLNRK